MVARINLRLLGLRVSAGFSLRLNLLLLRLRLRLRVRLLRMLMLMIGLLRVIEPGIRAIRGI
jgi:hypothetical protein